MSGSVLELPWLMFGGRLVFDALSVSLLAATTLVWGLAGWAAVRPSAGLVSRPCFGGCFVLTAAASLLVTVAGDGVTFFLAYSVLGLAAYPLIAAPGTRRALRAARGYIAFVLVGEGALLAALLLASDGTTPPVAFPPLAGPLMAALVLVGVGVKSGVPGLHSWMPAAYSAAPNAAATALAGGTISVGILGFLRLGVGAQPTGLPSLAWLGIGVAGAIFGVARGLVQREPERILAYSSVSQMGMALAALAFGSLVAAEASAVSVAMAAFLFHHALAKASLFLGVGAVRGGVKVGGRADHPIILAMLSLPALALAGLPFTSGAIAKGALVDAIPTQGLDVLLLAASAGTTALMLHFVVTVRDLSRVEAGRGTPGWGLRGPWFTSVAVAAVGVWLWPDFRVAAAHALRPAAVWHGLPPLVAGGLAWAFARRAGWRGTRRISLGERAAYALAVRWGDWSVRRREVRPRLRHLPADVRRRARHLVSAAEGGVDLLDSRVGTWTLTGTLFIALLLALRMAL